MRELIVDNFAGGGGASTGIEQATGRPVDIAINHDRKAIAMHRANHPRTLHLNENVWSVDPAKVCPDRPVGLAWFSPDCTHHSKARGGKPVKKKIRALAWVAVRWADKRRPRVIVIENVEEFIGWGPLVKGDDGKLYPCPKRKGRNFRSFVNALKKLGYKVEHRELRACDYGAPTIRKRLFLIARCDGRPIVWPEPTHGDPASEAVKSGRLKPWRTAAECIDWDLPCPSIFLTKEEAKKYRVKRPLAEATLRRIARGVMKYVVEAEEPFIVPLTHQGGDRTEGVNEPFKTITGANRGEKAFVTPFIAPIAHYNGSNPVHDVNQPMRTVTANPKGGAFALATPFMARTDMHKSNSRCVYDPKDPLRTVTSGGGHAVVMPQLMVNTTGHAGGAVDAPVPTITTGGHHYLVSPTLIQTGYGEHEGQKPRAPGLHKPLGTVVAGGSKHALVSAFLAKHYGGVVGHGVKRPIGTTKFRTGATGADTKDPMPTVTAGGLHVGEVRAFLMKYYGTDQDPKLREPMHTVTTKDRFGLVTVQGTEYVIADIGLRMFAPRELFRAQGFSDTYIIDRDADGNRFTKTDQVAFCGNAVPPNFARAIARANYSEAHAVTRPHKWSRTRRRMERRAVAA